MSNINHDYIENYIQALLPDSKGILKDMEDYAKEYNVPIITPDVRTLLSILIKTSGAKRILEIGTAIGYSSILMAISAGKDSEIISMEKNPELAELARKNIEIAGYKNTIKVLQGDAADLLDEINGEYDMIFLDGAKGHYYDFFKKSVNNLKIGGLFVCDNVLFRGMVAERSLLKRRKITIVKRLKKFLTFLSENSALQTSIVPIGDGLSISIKLEEVILDD